MIRARFGQDFVWGGIANSGYGFFLPFDVLLSAVRVVQLEEENAQDKETTQDNLAMHQWIR